MLLRLSNLTDAEKKTWKTAGETLWKRHQTAKAKAAQKAEEKRLLSDEVMNATPVYRMSEAQKRHLVVGLIHAFDLRIIKEGEALHFRDYETKEMVGKFMPASWTGAQVWASAKALRGE